MNRSNFYDRLKRVSSRMHETKWQSQASAAHPNIATGSGRSRAIDGKIKSYIDGERGFALVDPHGSLLNHLHSEVSRRKR